MRRIDWGRWVIARWVRCTVSFSVNIWSCHRSSIKFLSGAAAGPYPRGLGIRDLNRSSGTHVDIALEEEDTLGWARRKVHRPWFQQVFEGIGLVKRTASRHTDRLRRSETLVIRSVTNGPWRSLASALAWGARGPGFKSRRPDQPNQSDTAVFGGGAKAAVDDPLDEFERQDNWSIECSSGRDLPRFSLPVLS
jgi:hypothetical protein